MGLNSLPRRTQRALDLVGTVKKIGDTEYIVHSQSNEGRAHAVEYAGIEDYWCSCPDHQHREVCCKHIRAVAIHIGRTQ
ncbi:MAG: SWIM zinc finger family protein [Halopenitus sp.]